MADGATPATARIRLVQAFEQRERLVYRAEVRRVDHPYQERDIYLLVGVRLDTRKGIVADHLWVRSPRFERAGVVAGMRVRFSAQVRRYQRIAGEGYGYTLCDIRAVEIIEVYNVG